NGNAAGKLAGHSDWISSLAFSPDNARLVSGSLDGQVLMWDVAGAKKVIDVQARVPPAANTPQTAAPPVTSLSFRSDGKMLAIGNGAGQIHLVNPADGKVIRATQAAHASSVTGLAFHPGLAVLASCSKDRTVKLWDVNSGAQLINLDGHTAWVQGVVFLEKG